VKRYSIACAAAISLISHIGVIHAQAESDITPDPVKADSDTAVVDTVNEATIKRPPALGPLVPYSGVDSRTTVSWWPLDMGRSYENCEYRSDWMGLIAAPAFTGGLQGLETPGYVWMGIPWTGIQEIGGDASVFLPLSTAEIVRSQYPPYVSGGRSTVYFIPLMDPIISPLTRVQTLRGPRRDTLYGLDFGTRATGLISSEVAIGYRETDGDRTNSQTTMKQYDWRVDLQPPIIGPCTIFNHFTETDRGIPGPHPSYWYESDVSDSLMLPRYWAIERGYGTEDAMWRQGSETVSTNLLALRFMQRIRDSIPLHLSIARDRSSIKTAITTPVVSESTVAAVPVQSECSTDRTAFSGRFTFAENGVDSIWSIVSIERIKRTAEFEIGSDTVSTIDWDESERRSSLGLGLQLGSTESFISIVRGVENRYAGAFNTEKRIGDFAFSGTFTYGWDERRLDDILRWHIRSYPEPPVYKGGIGSLAIGVRHDYAGGSIESSCRYGFGNDVWGWCCADSIPGGEFIQWGPSNPTQTGIEFAIKHGLFTWLRINGQAGYTAWRVDDVRVPGIPDIHAELSLEFDYPIQRRARPHGILRLRHVGKRYWGWNNTFERDSYISLEGYVSVDIGDFAILLIGQNLLGTEYEDIPGYPIVDRSIHFGFHWKFLD